VDGLHEREQRRAEAIEALQTLRPAIDSARQAWEPYAGPIRDLEHALEAELRPAMWHADHDARQGGFRHRCSSERRAADASAALEQAQADIASIHADGAPVKEHLDQLQRRAATLRTRAEPIEGLETLDRNLIRQLDQLLDAAATYTGWLEGRPTATARLAHAVDTLAAVAKTAPSFARHAGEADQTQWYELLDLAPNDLHREAARRSHEPEIKLGR
jgi:hypothetical protein